MLYAILPLRLMSLSEGVQQGLEVVTKDVPPHATYVGNPAAPLRGKSCS